MSRLGTQEELRPSRCDWERRTQQKRVCLFDFLLTKMGCVQCCHFCCSESEKQKNNP